MVDVRHTGIRPLASRCVRSMTRTSVSSPTRLSFVQVGAFGYTAKACTLRPTYKSGISPNHSLCCFPVMFAVLVTLCSFCLPPPTSRVFSPFSPGAIVCTAAKMRLAAFLGCERAFFSAPMLGSGNSELASAVARAGGVGMIPCSGMPAPKLDELIRRLSTDAQLTQPGLVGYNFFCHKAPDENWDASSPLSLPWRQTLSPFFDREGVSQAQLEQACRAAHDTRFNDAQCRVIAQHAREGRVKVVSFHFGLPEPDLWTTLRSVDGLVTMCSATTVREALYLAEAGVDIIVCQGAEAGGHRGTFLEMNAKTCADPLGLFALLPQVRRAVGEKVYLIAAGGVVDARTAHAACVLGADGVQCGTVFLTTQEAATNRLHRRAIEQAKASEDAALSGTGSPLTSPSYPRNITNILTGRPARGIVNAVMSAVGCLRQDAPAYPMATPYMAALRAVAEPQARDDYTLLWAGQNLSGCPTGADGPSRMRADDVVHRISQGLSLSPGAYSSL